MRHHARAQALLLGVTLERELDQAIDQLGIATPVASHIFAYMLMVVKPGMVLISLTIDGTGRRVTAGSRPATCRRHPRRETLRWRAAGPRLACSAGRSAGMMVCELVVEILGFVIVELARRDDLAGQRRLRARRCPAPRIRFRARRAPPPRRQPCDRTPARARSPPPARPPYFTFEMPTLEPRLAGLTNSGRPSARAHLGHARRGRCPTRVAVNADPRHDRQPARGEHHPHGRLVHAHRPRPSRPDRHTARWRAPAGPARCRPRRTARAAPETRRRVRGR